MDIRTYAAFFDELTKQASVAGNIGQKIVQQAGHQPGALRRVGQHLADHGHAYDLGGLGILAAPSAMGLGEEFAKKRRGEAVSKKSVFKDGAELAGLATLAAPVAASALLHRGH